MAYNDAYLYKLMDAGQGTSLYIYDTLDAAATVDTAAYFTGNAVTKLRVGDVIIRRTWGTAIRTGTISTAGFHVVNANSGTAVDVTDATALDQTDTD